MNFLEVYAILAVIKNKREVALDGREARQRFVTHLAQIVLAEAVEIDLGDENILPQFARRGHVGMNLPKLGYSRAIQHGAGGATGVIVIGPLVFIRLGVVVQSPMAEGSEQAFDVALQVEE